MPTYRQTNAGMQTKGTLFAGFDPATTSILAGVFMLSVMATFASIAVLKMAWWFPVLFFFALPNLAILCVVFFLIMGKPPGYVRDWADSKILGRAEVNGAAVSEPTTFDLEK